ncbi:MAG: hypothetical protein NT027_11180 [Proteobacteria bacterium]|nr:hypothetical protein [Pseudomonadota bacterium]
MTESNPESPTASPVAHSLRASNTPKSTDQSTAILSGTLCLTEIGLGSTLHGFHVPFAGSILSLNQIYVMSVVSRIFVDAKKAGSKIIEISVIAALFKSLSPVGKKLTPMVAISIQGWLFSLPVIFFGNNILGLCLGAVLSASWGIIQPIAFACLLYGSIFGTDSVIKMTSYYQKLVHDFLPSISLDLVHIVLIFFGLKSFIAVILSILGRYGPLSERFQNIFKNFQRAESTQRDADPACLGPCSKVSLDEKLEASAITISSAQLIPSQQSSSWQDSLLGSAKDVLKMRFLIPVFLTGIFFFFAEHSWSAAIWSILQPMTVGLVFFFILRFIPWQKLILVSDHRKKTLNDTYLLIQTFLQSRKK